MGCLWVSCFGVIETTGSRCSGKEEKQREGMVGPAQGLQARTRGDCLSEERLGRTCPPRFVTEELSCGRNLACLSHPIGHHTAS